ncbi:hypothetical protein [Staphylothermus hellenicus]|uniref:Uncharacterized protein n=1 Tax=Staphylothermus hellenicus (strain DSM 12710 / JCM 10830 / BK20S6-10-b1 / P8) TaxID=591019 RepID=D7DAL6_STAHD|nr:hypothetical protein [Staphylothermus hellenicus]ADI31213.1 hypothetical protein Shell_0064 [Staphylothermus hellenicus DSM 12710]
MNSDVRIEDHELQEALGKAEKKEEVDEKQKWIQRMIRSAKHHHKICPYYDKKTGMCFLTLGEKCPRDGRYETCPVFREFLEKKYEEYKSKGLPLPVDFADITITPF